MTPGAAGNLATIKQNSSVATITTEAEASHWWLMGLNITVDSGTTTVFRIVDLQATAASVALLPHHIVLDRCWIHGHDTCDSRQGVALNSTSSGVINCYIEKIHSEGSDAQAIWGYNAPGPLKIVNNTLIGSGENILFGGADPTDVTFMSTDIEIRYNTITKPNAWFLASKKWSVKNLIELKVGRRVLIEGNDIHGNWDDSQAGDAIVIQSTNQGGSANFSETSDVTIRWNKIHNSTGCINLSAKNSAGTVVRLNKVLIHHNIMYDLSGDSQFTTNSRWAFILLNDIQGGLEISSNTVVIGADCSLEFHDGTVKIAELICESNIFAHKDGWDSTAAGIGTPTLDATVATYTFTNNVIYTGSGGNYPSGQTFPADLAAVKFVNVSTDDYHLDTGSPALAAGVGGIDAGANVNDVETSIALAS